MQNFHGPTGTFSCSECDHPGISVVNLKGKNTYRYINQSSSELRTHEKTVMTSAECSNKQPKYGIKGVSAALMFNDIDVIGSFPIDFMHGVCLGITKDLVSIWMGIRRIPKPPCTDYMIKSVEKRRIFSARNFKIETAYIRSKETTTNF